ncbi:MAG: radical SAM protein [Candidatus Falkowbacteria bacterium]|nr:radical SAM protein [Candidatus Falkowbacteria bacterium]
MVKIEISMPFYEIRLSLTGNCNHKCFYCGPFSDGKANNGYKELSLEQIKKIAPLLKEKELHIQLTGGEPTLRRDLIEAVEILSNSGIKDIGITTNGSLINLYYTQKLLTAGISDIHIHMPSLDNEIFKKTTQDKRSRVVNTIKQTSLYLKQQGKGIEFNTPVTCVNLKTIPQLIDFCYENKINLKLAEEVTPTKKQIKEEEIVQIFEDWFKNKELQFDETKINKKYGRIYNFGDFYFRVAPATKGLADFLNGKGDTILYDGRYWIGGRDGKFLFAPSYFLNPIEGNYKNLKKNLDETMRVYENNKN